MSAVTPTAMHTSPRDTWYDDAAILAGHTFEDGLSFVGIYAERHVIAVPLQRTERHISDRTSLKPRAKFMWQQVRIRDYCFFRDSGHKSMSFNSSISESAFRPSRRSGVGSINQPL